MEQGYEILQYLLPENHEPGRYTAEPFVLAADVYSANRPSGGGRLICTPRPALWYFGW